MKFARWAGWPAPPANFSILSSGSSFLLTPDRARRKVEIEIHPGIRSHPSYRDGSQ